ARRTRCFVRPAEVEAPLNFIQKRLALTVKLRSCSLISGRFLRKCCSVLGKRQSCSLFGVKELSSLLEVSQALASADDLDAVLHRVLERLEKHHAVEQATVTMLDLDSKEISIRASLGLGREEKGSTYQLG